MPAARAQEPPRKRTRCKTSPASEGGPSGEAKARRSSASAAALPSASASASAGAGRSQGRGQTRGQAQQQAQAKAPGEVQVQATPAGAAGTSTAAATTAASVAADTSGPASTSAGAAGAAGAASAASAGAGLGTAQSQGQGQGQGLAFLRLSSECSPSAPGALKELVYLNRDELTVGRLPSCDVLLDSPRVPQMISRVHGKLQRQDQELGSGPGRWVLVDNKSLNGILVNNEKLPPEEARVLQTGDVITFGRKMTPPEFEYVFTQPQAQVQQVQPPHASEPAAAPEAGQPPAADELMHEQMEKIAQLEEELKVEREQKRAQREQKRASKSALDLSDLHSELACSICQDWLVLAATIECSHSFCWSCIDTWLVQKHFECPVCRHAVTREPVKNRAIDNLVQKSVDRLASSDQQEYAERLTAAETAAKKAQRLHAELEKSVADAQKKGKNFFSIDSQWSKRERDTFARGVKDYSGNTRETYCKLTGLTVQWVHTADGTKLNRALHNLMLQRFVDKSDEEIRQRLLMYLRYG